MVYGPTQYRPAAPPAPRRVYQRPPVYRRPAVPHVYRKPNVYNPYLKRPVVQRRPVVYQSVVPVKPIYYPVAPVEEKKEVIKTLIEEKVDLVKSALNGTLLTELVQQKTNIVKGLLNGSLTPGLLTPVVPALGGLPVLPALKPLTPLTDDSLKAFLPIAGKDLGTLNGPRLRAAPIDISASLACAGKDSIGFPPGAILCAENSRAVQLTTAPFMVFVDNRGSSPGRGFAFNYRQQICS